MTYQYLIKRLYKWCLIFQQSEGGNCFSDTKHIDQLRICFDRWESRATRVMLGEAVQLFQGKAEQGRFMEINKVVC